MMKQVMNIVSLVVLTIVVVMSGVSHGAETDHFGKVNVAALNTGNLQLKGVTWCKKYFDVCVVTETWMGPTLQDRQTATVKQYVTMQTGVMNPDIKEVDIESGDKLRITFVYDQNTEHSHWIPEYTTK